jgi:porin
VSDSSALYWNFDQYLVVDSRDSSKGWGVFGRAAIADDDTNPLEWLGRPLCRYSVVS